LFQKLCKKLTLCRDLKPENLLLDRDGHVVLTDFGLCKENIKPSDTTETFCGTPEYLAPEIVLKQPYDQTVDWWCLGSVLYEMLTGLVIDLRSPHYSQERKILVKPLQTSSQIFQLLDKDCTSRLGAKGDFGEVKCHPFFAQIDFEKLEKKEIKPPYVPRVNGEMDLSQIDREFTSQQPNSESLIPSKTYEMHRGDVDFQGFSFAS
uniref:Serine/threonine-protein kinase Sgk3 n=1 Tax=Gongylonema pulchrum TaxID=637853 RepID=A0A183D9N9_9BILA